MYIPKHPNYIKSSNLIFGTVALGLISLLLSPEILASDKFMAISVLSLLIVIGLGFVVRDGIEWIKYLLLVLFIFGAIGLPFTILNIVEKPLVGLINIVQTGMQLWAIILLFKVPSIPKSNGMQQFDEHFKP